MFFFLLLYLNVHNVNFFLLTVIPDKCDVCNSKISRSDEIDQTQLEGLFNGQLASNTEPQPVVIQILDQQQQQTNLENIEIQDVVTDDVLEPVNSVVVEVEETNNVYGRTNGPNIHENSFNLNNSELLVNDFEKENNIQVHSIPSVNFNYSQENMSSNVSEMDEDASINTSTEIEIQVNHNQEMSLNTAEQLHQIDELPVNNNHEVSLNTSEQSLLLTKNKNVNEDQDNVTENMNDAEEEEGDSCMMEKSVALEKIIKPDAKLTENRNKTSDANTKVISTDTPVIRRSLRKKKENNNKNDIVKDVYPYSCLKCDKGFMEEKYFKSHMKAFHSDKSVICDKCGKSFRNNSLLKKHERFHDETVEKYSCDQCDKTFVDENLFKRHKNSHLGVRPFTCEICGRSFPQMGHLNCHKETHKDKKSRKFKCKYCDLTFADATSRLRHTRTHTGARPYQCKECGKNFRQYSHLQEHLRIHSGERPFSCDVCGNTFTDRSSFRKHQQMHQGVKFRCSECGKEFAQTSSLQRHMNKHTKEKSYNCDECGRSFLYLQALQYHKVKHKQGWKCKMCQETFKSKEEYTIHVKKHNDEIRYKCEICFYEFKTSAGLKQHYKAHENKTDAGVTLVHTINIPIIVMNNADEPNI